MALMGNPNLTKEEEDNYNTTLELISLCKQEQVFSINGELYLGNHIEVVKKYIKLNPSKKFIIWVKDNIPALTPHH